jgi:TPR repeat protein
MDTIKAVSRLSKAAEQEYPSAQYRLAECYQNGIGVEKDDVKASQWRQIADSNGEIPF